jgi:hypothetical protein
LGACALGFGLHGLSGARAGAGLLGFGHTALAAAPVLAASSPRLVGEAAYGVGRAARGLGNLPARPIGQAAFQTGRLPLNPYSPP